MCAGVNVLIPGSLKFTTKMAKINTFSNDHLIHIDDELAEKAMNDEQFQKEFAHCLHCLEKTFNRFITDNDNGVLISIKVERPD